MVGAVPDQLVNIVSHVVLMVVAESEQLAVRIGHQS